MGRKFYKGNSRQMIFKKSFYVNEELSELLTPRNLKRGYKIEYTKDLLLKELEITRPHEKRKREHLVACLLRWDTAPSQFEEFGKYAGDVCKKEYIKEKILKYGFKFEDINIEPDNLRINVEYRCVTFAETGRYEKRSRLKFKLDIIGDKNIFCVCDDFCKGEIISQILSSRYYFLKESNKIYDYIVLAPRFPFGYYCSSKMVVEKIGLNIKNIILVLDQREFSYRNINKDDLDWKVVEEEDSKFGMLREKQDYVEEVNKASELDEDF